MNPLTDTQLNEMYASLTEIRGGYAQVKDLPATIKTLEAENTRLSEQLSQLRLYLTRTTPPTQRPRGQVTDDCARYIAATFIQHCAKSGKLEALSEVTTERDALLKATSDTLGITTRTALTTGDIPLPIQFGSQIRELISDFGVVRRKMSPYPIGRGIAKPARMGARPAFTCVVMSAAFQEKSPTITFAALESHKLGGIVKVPREIDEQSMVPMGHFLARYGAIEFARAEDLWGFLADGTGTYDGIKGIVQTAKDSSRVTTLLAGKTKPSDATLDDFRAMRRLVNKAALNGRISAYYLDSTWETRLPAFKTQAEPNVYQRLPDGTAILDGYPIIWTDVLQAYDTAAQPAQAIAVFGALDFWWFGEHGSPRLDTSEHVFFQNDQLAVRFIEEIDFDYCASDATSALITAAS
jgi:HK97 family phage major capsid protein